MLSTVLPQQIFTVGVGAHHNVLSKQPYRIRTFVWTVYFVELTPMHAFFFFIIFSSLKIQWKWAWYALKKDDLKFKAVHF